MRKPAKCSASQVFCPRKIVEIFQMAKYIVVHSVRVCTEFTPETYGRLTTIGPAFLLPVGKQAERIAYQACICACGNRQVVYVGNLRNMNTTSCGCARRESVTALSHKHGGRRLPEYNNWCLMRSRCANPNNRNYSDYGGRGIRVCPRWENFADFLTDMGPRPSPKHTLDRFPDQNGNYEKSNCRWATKIEQANNKRNNRLITIAGKTDTLANWARLHGINYRLVHARISQGGWSVQQALTTPLRPKR